MSATIAEQTQRSFMIRKLRDLARHCFGKMDIEVDGKRFSVSGDFKINDDKVLMRFLKAMIGFNRIALGESFVDGQWESDLMEFFDKFLSHRLLVFNPVALFISNSINMLPFHLFNLHTKSRNKKDVAAHYDIGNDLFALMLGQTMNYSAAYWVKNASIQSTIEDKLKDQKTNEIQLCSDIDEAQINKMLLIAKKLNLKPGMTVLDIGCGWGTFVKFLAINFDVNVIGITISEKQYEYAINNNIESEGI